MKEKEDGEKIPLKTILTNFLNHVETLEVKREEGEDLYEKEFQVKKIISLLLLVLHTCLQRCEQLQHSWKLMNAPLSHA